MLHAYTLIGFEIFFNSERIVTEKILERFFIQKQTVFEEIGAEIYYFARTKPTASLSGWYYSLLDLLISTVSSTPRSLLNR